MFVELDFAMNKTTVSIPVCGFISCWNTLFYCTWVGDFEIVRRIGRWLEERSTIIYTLIFWSEKVFTIKKSITSKSFCWSAVQYVELPMWNCKCVWLTAGIQKLSNGVRWCIIPNWGVSHWSLHLGPILGPCAGRDPRNLLHAEGSKCYPYELFGCLVR